MLYLSREDKDALVCYLQNVEVQDVFREGYNEGFRRAVNLVCELVDHWEYVPEETGKSLHQISV